MAPHQRNTIAVVALSCLVCMLVLATVVDSAHAFQLHPNPFQRHSNQPSRFHDFFKRSFAGHGDLFNMVPRRRHVNNQQQQQQQQQLQQQQLRQQQQLQQQQRRLEQERRQRQLWEEEQQRILKEREAERQRQLEARRELAAARQQLAEEQALLAKRREDLANRMNAVREQEQEQEQEQQQEQQEQEVVYEARHPRNRASTKVTDEAYTLAVHPSTHQRRALPFNLYWTEAGTLMVEERSRSPWAFKREYKLPSDVAADEVTAHTEPNGALVVTFPRHSQQQQQHEDVAQQVAAPEANQQQQEQQQEQQQQEHEGEHQQSRVIRRARLPFHQRRNQRQEERRANQRRRGPKKTWSDNLRQPVSEDELARARQQRQAQRQAQRQTRNEQFHDVDHHTSSSTTTTTTTTTRRSSSQRRPTAGGVAQDLALEDDDGFSEVDDLFEVTELEFDDNVEKDDDASDGYMSARGDFVEY